MPSETLVRTEETRRDTKESKKSLLQTIAKLIRRDSGREAERYLEETTVPHGGE